MTQTKAAQSKIAVLMTCFNRRELTLGALAALHRQQNIDDLELTVYLVDDKSRDGTSQAVQEQFPAVYLIHGDGTLFWNGGMRVAFAQAMADGHDAYLWMNDDNLLEGDALSRLVQSARQHAVHSGAAIVVGSMCDPATGAWSYGGWREEKRGIKLLFHAVQPDKGGDLRSSTMNGNFVLIPDSVARTLGNLDPRFRHQFGDIDYGLRATKKGISIFVVPGFVGSCVDNSSAGTWRDAGSTLSQRWKHILSPKGSPPREWLLYTWRHFGWRSIFYAPSPYLKALLGRS